MEEAFADVLRELMLRRGISQSQIAHTVRVDRSRVSEWSRGPAVPSPKVLERLAETYGLDLDRLMRICNYRVGRPLFATDPDELELLALYRQIPIEFRSAAKAAFRKTKGGAPRDVVVQQPARSGGRCQEALRAWLKIRRAQPGVVSLFTTCDGWPLSERRVREIHRMYGTRARVDGPVFPHRWRHSAASEALAEGISENAIRDRLGHLSRASLDTYITLSDRVKTIAAERASLSEKWHL